MGQHESFFSLIADSQLVILDELDFADRQALLPSAPLWSEHMSDCQPCCYLTPNMLFMSKLNSTD